VLRCVGMKSNEMYQIKMVEKISYSKLKKELQRHNMDVDYSSECLQILERFKNYFE